MRNTILNILVGGGILILGAILTQLFARAMYRQCRSCGTLNARRRTQCRRCGTPTSTG
ncbi:MAG: hypothetical protein ACE5G5_13220 [Candidatus Methylomirabilales bacterium]